MAEARGSKVYAPCLNPENTQYRSPSDFNNWVNGNFSCEYHEAGFAVDFQ
jgi:hypothetical protein